MRLPYAACVRPASTRLLSLRTCADRGKLCLWKAVEAQQHVGHAKRSTRS